MGKKLSVLLLSVFLFACMEGQVKQFSNVNDAVNLKNTADYVDIDSDVELDFKSAVALIKQNKNVQAVEVLESVIEREQRLTAPYVNIAIAYNKLGNEKLAEENLIKALKLDIGDAVANNELGLLYRKTGKFNAARTAYQNAIAKHPYYLPAKRNLGVLCDLYLHDFNCALEQFQDYLDIKPDDKDVSIWVADVKRRLGK